MRTTGVGSKSDRTSVAGRARRDQIIRAAGEVVAEVGYANTSTARIAERAGISKGVLTYHFESKDEILRLVALQLFDRCAQHVVASLGDTSDPAAVIRGWLTAELQFFGDHCTEYRAMSEIMANHRDPDFSLAFQAESDKEAAYLTELLARGQAEGTFRVFDADDVAQIILRCRNGLLDSWTEEAAQLDPVRSLSARANTLLEFIEHAIIARPGVEEARSGS